MKEDIAILYEDRDILVCEKPAGVPAQDDRSGSYDMVSRIRNHVAAGGSALGKIPYVGVVHRLDRPVGGIMVFAKNQKAAGGLSRQLQQHDFSKKYWCVLTQDMGDTANGPLTLTDYVYADKRTNLSQIVGEHSDGAKKAVLEYRVLDAKKTEQGVLSLAEVTLHTGRHHQIRVQMAEHFTGIWGDMKYNVLFQKNTKGSQIALYACCLGFTHPVTGEPMVFRQQLKRLEEQYPFSCFADKES